MDVFEAPWGESCVCAHMCMHGCTHARTTGPITPYPLPLPPPPPPEPRAVPGTDASAFLFFLEKEKIENCCVHICLSLGSPALFSASRLCQNSRRARDLAASHSSPDARLYNCAELIYWSFCEKKRNTHTEVFKAGSAVSLKSMRSAISTGPERRPQVSKVSGL